VTATDVLVAGGGPAGAAAAAAARAEGLEVELVDAAGGAPRPGESLPPGTDAVLDQIFGPRGFDSERHRPAYGNRSVWGAEGLDEAEFMLNPLGHGWHIDRMAFDASLLDSLRAMGVAVHQHVRLAGQAWGGDGWDVALDGGTRSLHARAIIDATGRSARVARSQGARRHRLDRLVAAYWLLATSGQSEADSTTLVEAVADGWWYTTPLPGGHRVAGFLTDSDLIPPRTARTAAGWSERLGRAPRVEDSLLRAGCRLHGSPRINDAGLAYMDRVAGPGWVAAGDAAVSFDPLSSQGIVTALLMGRAAGAAIAAMVRKGDPEPLIGYGAEYTTLLQQHRRQRSAFYGLERRWPEAPFWSRRLAPLPVAP
jgi:flavin-dependent dehydrogenase